jgi:replication initiation protein RepC
VPGRQTLDRAGELILNATFGIDLSAAVQQIDACERAAERYDVERGLRRDLKRRRTIAVKATRQAIDTALEYELAVDVQSLEDGLAALPDVADPWVPFAVLQDCTARAESLRAAAEGEVQDALGRAQRTDHHVDDQEDLDPAGPIVSPHIHFTTDPKIDSSSYSNAALQRDSRRDRPQTPSRRAAGSATTAPGGGENTAANSDNHGHGSDYISRSMALKLMPKAMQDFMAEAFPDSRTPTWANLVDIAYWHIGSLKISENAWAQACEAIGRNGAAIAVFIIASKAHEIRKPDRYLRSMACRAEAGQLQLHRSAWGILRGGNEEQGHA